MFNLNDEYLRALERCSFALRTELTEPSSMATQSLRSPYFSEDVAWLPCWFQNLRTNGFNELAKESQAPYNQEAKDLASSEENTDDCKDFHTISREEGRYKSCHLFLSGDNSSPISVASSPENVFHFSLRLSSDVDSLFCLNQDLSESHDVVAPSKALSLKPVQPSIEFREDTNSMMDHLVCEPDVSAAFIPETMQKDASEPLVDAIDSVGQQKERSKIKCFESMDITNAVELSIVASEALVIHDLAKMDFVSETICTEALLEIALHVKQARLEGLQDGFHSSGEESDCSDSLSDLNDFIMEDAFEDIGLPIGVPFEDNLCNSATIQVKGVPHAENGSQHNKKHSDNELISQFVNMNDKSKQKQLEFNMEMEMQQNTDLPLHSLYYEMEMQSDDPCLGAHTPKNVENHFPISDQFIENSANILAPNQTVGLAMVDSIPIKPLKSVDPSLVENSGNSKNENRATFLAPERFRSRWLGGWTSKELDSSSLNRNNTERIPKFPVRETSFLTESVDVVPDESSCVLKHDPKCAIGSRLSMPSEDSQNKLDEGKLQSQDVVRCSSLSLTDPLCSVVPCSISSETHIDKENDARDFVPSISEFEVDNFERISDKNVTLGCRDVKIMSVLDGKDIPFTTTKMGEQMTEKLTRAEHASLKTYSMIQPNQDLNLNCDLTAFLTNQSESDATSLGTRISESLSATEHADVNKNEENNQYLVDHKSIIEITNDKSGDELELKAADASGILAEPTKGRRPPFILNRRTGRWRLLGPKIVVEGIGLEKNTERRVTAVQHQQNNNHSELPIECNKPHGGHVRVKKQVHFSEKVEEIHPKRKLSKLESSYKRCSSVRAKRQRVSKSLTTLGPHLKHSLTNNCRSFVNEFIFHGIEFLLTGLSSQRERDLEALIRNSGGVVIYDIPSPQNSRSKRSSALPHLKLPIILCTRKLQTTKFLYGCAVGASILKLDWLTDCLASGTILQPAKYMILPNRNDMKWTRIGAAVQRHQKHVFQRVGIVLHGKHSFCTKLASIIKHGGGQVFKTLQWLVRSTDEERTLVGVIVVEDKTTISRHLKQCAKERNIPMVPYNWIIQSLYSGKLFPFTEEKNKLSLPFVKVSEAPSSSDMSEEI
ncbi:hypothetical protein RJT34_27471 [Clitoria ternatea]|uniref:BRCT domain-containing protein n=1 Tax=Clitoria ternatea TaxID=43366 RepID=A0AAN9IB04_CLITE